MLKASQTIKKRAAINLFKEGNLSSGATAVWLGINRSVFLKMNFEAGAALLEDTADEFARETALL